MEENVTQFESTQKVITTQPKWKSKYFWIAVASLIGFILGNWGLYDAIGLTGETYQTLVNFILALPVALGIFNDSGNSKEW